MVMKSEKELVSLNDHELMDAQIGYQVATNLRTSRADELWSQFNGIMTANTIILATTFVASSIAAVDMLIRLGMPIIGFILSLFWLFLHARGTEYSQYYLLSARELEEKYLNKTVKTLSRGGDFSDGKEISLFYGGKMERLKMSRLARIFRVRQISYIVIAAFTLMYITIFIAYILSCSK